MEVKIAIPTGKDILVAPYEIGANDEWYFSATTYDDGHREGIIHFPDFPKGLIFWTV